ncbi:MAG: STAS domain-containing protein [Oscillospiraceae bacterium]|nr:STAS domain-containing protein [Oscillospiraceae bacterium]
MKIYTAESNGSLRLSFTGELDHHGAKTAMKTIEGLIDERLPRNLIMDLSELNFMDSSGIALILRANRRMSDIGGKAWVENPLGQPLRVLNASGIERVIKVLEKAR